MHTILHRLLLAIVAIVLVAPLAAQPSAFTAEPQPMSVCVQEPQSLMMVDEQLCVATPRLLLQAVRQGSQVVGLQPDTMYSTLASDVRYVVRRPGTRELYFIASDRKGKSTLYYTYPKGDKWRTQKLSLGMEVEHPTFSADGRIMVFSSREGNHNRGGADLWYSLYDGEEWSRPASMGDRINTEGNELCPTIVGERLFFSSNGRGESKGRLHIYTTLLIAREVVGDTVGMLQIGRSAVQHLPEPFNRTGMNSIGLVADTAQGAWYWYVGSSLMTLRSPLEAVQLWGFVGDEQGQPIPGAQVEAYADGRRVGVATAVSSGFYYLVLPADSLFRIEVSAEGHYRDRFPFSCPPDSLGLLIAQHRRNATLGSMPIGRPIQYADLFAGGASVELSSFGQQQLDRLVAFLSDNPTLRAELTLRCRLLDDDEFSHLLAARRLQTLLSYIHQHLSDPSRVEGVSSFAEAEGCHLSVLLK